MTTTTHAAELVPVADLKPHPRNYRAHPPDQLAHIKASIRDHGFYRNVVIAREGTLLAGHGVIEACRELEVLTVPVVRLEIDPDSPEALRVLSGDNLIGHLAFDDDRILTDLLKDLAKDEQLLGTGFNDEQLAALLMTTRHASEIQDLDAAAEWVGMPDYEPGEKRLQLTITFPSKEERARYVEETSLHLDTAGERASWSTRWPWTERNDRSSVRFVDPEEDA